MMASRDTRGPLDVEAMAGLSDLLAVAPSTPRPRFCLFASLAATASLTSFVVPSGCLTTTFGLFTEPNFRPFLALGA